MRDLRLTRDQARVIGELDAMAKAAARDLSIALKIILAAHDIETAEIVGLDKDALTLRVRPLATDSPPAP